MLSSSGVNLSQSTIAPPLSASESSQIPFSTSTSTSSQEKNLFESQQGQYGKKGPWRDDDYEQKFPEDPMFEEAAPDARVWQTYLAESANFDENMIGEARDGLDAMLIFAGLFSSVVTSFLVQTSQNLQPNFAQMSTSLFTELIAVQRAAAEGRAVSSVPSSNLTLNLEFVPSAGNVWVNGLWALSLSLSLYVALASVLVKQWLHHYMALPSGTGRERAHLRHFRFVGFEKFRVRGIIGSLPVIQHLSLALFFIGLVIFLLPLQRVLSFLIGVFTLVVYVLYVATNILPVFDPQCPYQTPLSRFFFKIRTTLLPVRDESQTAPGHSRPSYLRGLEGAAVHAVYDSLTLPSLHWLFNVSSNPSVRSIVLQALGGLPASSKHEIEQLFSDCTPDILRLLLKYTSSVANTQSRQANVGFETNTERICRTISFFSAHSGLLNSFWSTSPMSSDISSVSFPQCNNPYFEASSFSIKPLGNRKGGMKSAQQYRSFISANHELRHHPMVWSQILLNAIQRGTIGRFVHGDDKEALFCAVILKAIWPAPRPLPPDHPDFDSVTVTMAEAIHEHWPKELKGILRRFFMDVHVSFDPFASNQILVVAMEFALDYISKHPQDPDNSYWKIIDHVLTHHDSTEPNTVFDFRADMFQPYVADFVDRLLEASDILSNDPLEYENDTITNRRALILTVYQKTRRRLLSVSLRAREPFQGSEFALLRAAVEGPLQTMRRLVHWEGLELSESTSLLFTRVLELLLLALRNGFTEAYEIFREHHCLELLYKFVAKQRKIEDPILWILNYYLMGLRTIAPAAKKQAIDYLYEPSHLRLSIALLPFKRFHPYALALDNEMTDALVLPTGSRSLPELLNQISHLRPTTSVGVWSDCSKWLSRVRDWAMDAEKEDKRDEETRQRQIEEFVDQSLGEEWLATVLQLPLLTSTDMEIQSFRSSSPFVQELEKIIRWLENFVV